MFLIRDPQAGTCVCRRGNRYCWGPEPLAVQFFSLREAENCASSAMGLRKDSYQIVNLETGRIERGKRNAGAESAADARFLLRNDRDGQYYQGMTGQKPNWTNRERSAYCFPDEDAAFQMQQKIARLASFGNFVAVVRIQGEKRQTMHYSSLPPEVFRRFCQALQDPRFWDSSGRILTLDLHQAFHDLTYPDVLFPTDMELRAADLTVREFQLEARATMRITFSDLLLHELPDQVREFTFTWSSAPWQQKGSIPDDELETAVQAWYDRQMEQLLNLIRRHAAWAAILELPPDQLARRLQRGSTVPLRRKDRGELTAVCAEIRGTANRTHRITAEFFPSLVEQDRSRYVPYCSADGMHYRACSEDLQHAVYFREGKMKIGSQWDPRERTKSSIRFPLQMRQFLDRLELQFPAQRAHFVFGLQKSNRVEYAGMRFLLRKLAPKGMRNDLALLDMSFLTGLLQTTLPALREQAKDLGHRLNGISPAQLSVLSVAQNCRGRDSILLGEGEEVFHGEDLRRVLPRFREEALEDYLAWMASHTPYLIRLPKGYQISSRAIPVNLPKGVRSGPYQMGELPFMKPDLARQVMPQLLAQITRPDGLWNTLLFLQDSIAPDVVLHFSRTAPGKQFFARFQGQDRDYAMQFLSVLADTIEGEKDCHADMQMLS